MWIVTLRKAREGRREEGGLERLEQKVVGAGSHRLDRGENRAVPCQDEDGTVRLTRLRGAHDVEPISVRQPEVGDADIRRQASQRVARVNHRAHCGCLVSELLDELDERRSDPWLVLDHEDLHAAPFRSASPSSRRGHEKSATRRPPRSVSSKRPPSASTAARATKRASAPSIP